jgi:regulator of protease activity HflC (stomatin/prohibitin superfamily)
MKTLKKVGCFVAVILAIGVVFRWAIVVPAGHRAVVFNLGKGVEHRSLKPGLHFILPAVQTPHYFNVRRQTYSMSKTAWEGEVRGDDSMTAKTADGQDVTVEISLRFHPDPDNVWRLFQNVGEDYLRKIIRPEMRSHVRIAFAEYPAAEVFSAKRRVIQKNIEDGMRAKLGANYIIVDDLLIRDVSFSPAFQDAIIAKQIEQQRAQRMKYVLQKEQLTKQKNIILAQGEAEAIRLKGQAVAANAKVISYDYARKVAPNVELIITDGQRVPVPGMPAVR